MHGGLVVIVVDDDDDDDDISLAQIVRTVIATHPLFYLFEASVQHGGRLYDFGTVSVRKCHTHTHKHCQVRPADEEKPDRPVCECGLSATWKHTCCAAYFQQRFTVGSN